MAFLSINNVVLKGISACVPREIMKNISSPIFSSKEEANKFIATTGIFERRKANQDTTTSDLCFHAAKQLITELSWNIDDIDCLVFVTQTPDYILPATSCVLQDRLGLSEECFTIDISLGCSGWVYGLSVLSNLLATGNVKKGLLLVGDTTLKMNSDQDKSTWPLFGDAGTATALEYQINSDKLSFHLATDGKGYDAIIIPDGGYRNPVSLNSFNYSQFEEGIVRNRLHGILNGMDVFSFGISKAPESINKLIEHFSLDKELIDYFIFHQANKFMNEKIRKKLKLPEAKVPYSLELFGNTSSATIPLTMVTQLRNKLQSSQFHMLACGFGVGLSWGTVHFTTNNIVCPPLIEL